MKRLGLILILLAAPLRAAVPDVASAATITLHGSGIYRITGTALISTISGVRDGDVILLLPSAAFTMNSAGNIQPVTTTATVGRPIYLVVANGVVYEQGPSVGGVTSPVAIVDGGTGQTSKTPAFNALSPVTTKGDLIARDSTNNVRVAVGADGDVLTADSTQAAGVKFTTPVPSGGGTEYAEDTASADAEKLTMAGVIRQDTATNLLSASGDRGEMQIDSSGRLWVNGSSVTQPVSGAFFQATQPVSGVFWQVTQPVSLTAGNFPDNEPFNMQQVAGTTADTNSGTKSAGTLRVVLATDQPALTNKLLVTPDALPANQSVNFNQTAGSATLTGNGVTGAGSQRVTIASDNTAFPIKATGNAGAAFDAADNAAMPANRLAVGMLAATIDTSPTAATAGNLRSQLASTEGVTYVQEGGPKRFSCFLQAVTVTTQCQAAPAAGLRAYVTSAHFSNQAATVQTLDIVYGTGANCVTGTTALTHKWQMGTNATTTSPQSIDPSFPTPLIPVAANAICVRPSAATAFGVTLTGFIAP